MKLEFSGKRALILGGTCEMALVLAKILLENQIFPILTYRNTDGYNRIHNCLKNVPKDCFHCLHVDFSTNEFILPENLDYLIDFLQEDFESLIPGACNNTIESYFTTNITRRSQVIQRVSRNMLAQRKGRLIYVSSTAALRPNPGQGFYAAAKTASEAIYRNVGLELGDRGITAVSLRVGYIESGRGRTYITNTPSIKKYVLKMNQVVETILFLMSDSATGLNGVEILMDRGLTSGKALIH